METGQAPLVAKRGQRARSSDAGSNRISSIGAFAGFLRKTAFNWDERRRRRDPWRTDPWRTVVAGWSGHRHSPVSFVFLRMPLPLTPGKTGKLSSRLIQWQCFQGTWSLSGPWDAVRARTPKQRTLPVLLYWRLDGFPSESASRLPSCSSGEICASFALGP